ncbi:MAG: alpha-amylase [Candidatus Marinimicrobia bacterium]|nr:alpha-amylase [Candidatus Neomarinimicrobiota bacterium]
MIFQIAKNIYIPLSDNIRLDQAVRREFHIARDIRDKYGFNELLFALDGNVVLTNYGASHEIVREMNADRKLSQHPEQALLASDLNALGLIDEILHYLFGQYRTSVQADILDTILDWLDTKYSVDKIDRILEYFIAHFPPVEVFRNNSEPAIYLTGTTAGESNRAHTLEELILHWLANINPAFEPFRELFDDSELENQTGYRQIMADLTNFFNSQKPFGPNQLNLIDLLRQPALAVPNSLADQLRFIRDNWGDLLGRFLLRMLRGLDFSSEEQKDRGFGPGEVSVLEFGLGEDEYERFSPDSDWMPRVVMIAKNALVWLDQLSKNYGYSIERLDQIPDAELDRLAQYGFTALWLIGLWKRSRVSQKIKQWCGNPEAESSAYSLKEYIIADSLGGPEAFENLKVRCQQRGIRLASDMVPNHTGLDANWIIEHPEWYVQTQHSPYPAYKFESDNLTEDDRISIQIEDHYYDQSDAAVVFRYVNRQTGEERFIYHGNDGTSMPWNDTAQLNYLLPEVREAVIQTILHVARQTPIIRFDAAMTLAKRHFQRLWFPEPGSGGDIPSRAEQGLSKEEFNQHFPHEFWREVVDRVAEEVPHTLLLAEAFWMMEGYFVRTLGMHRVYNSAFMNMLKMEDNAKYRQTIKNTLEFDPQILKRFVNFLNNPDEETAAIQFGTGDKYFGTTLLMLTMPGLPMFGHGQIEGFREKYGMEFRQAYWDEQPDQELVQRHEWDIFPVLRKRYLFAEVAEFRLFDLYNQDGSVNENVFAYTNRVGNESVLVLYNNAYQQANGWLRTSAAFNDKSVSDKPNLRQVDLAQALNLPNDPNRYLVLREHTSGLEYLRHCSTIHEQGLPVSLNGYQYQVFWEMREVWDDQYGRYGQLHNMLNGQGVTSIEESIKDIFLKPVRDSFTAVFNEPGLITVELYINEIVNLTNSQVKVALLSGEITESIAAVDQFIKMPIDDKNGDFDYIKTGLTEEIASATLRIWGLLRLIGKAVNTTEYQRFSRRLISELGLEQSITNILSAAGLPAEQIERQILLIKILCRYQHHLEAATSEKARELFRDLLDDNEIHRFLGINRFEGIIYFNQEAIEDLTWWLTTITVVDLTISDRPLDDLLKLLQRWQVAAIKSEFQLEKLLEELK